MSAKNPPQDRKPNILVIWGDDVGMWNISAYHRGMMGGSTPNIDRIANEGMIFMNRPDCMRAKAVLPEEPELAAVVGRANWRSSCRAAAAT